MADLEILRTAIQSLFPDEVYPRFTKVADGAVPPWTSVAVSLPAPSTRAMTTRVLSKRVVIRCRVTAANDLAVWQLATPLLAALEGVRIDAAGWDASPIQQMNDNPTPYEDTDMTLAPNNSHPVILPLDFDFFTTTKETA